MLLRDRFRFFHEHAGYVVGEAAVCALRLARAEERAERLGLRVEWEPEHEPWDGDCPAPPIVAFAYVPRLDDHKLSLASLGMVGLNDWRDHYKRVVEAELFAEALATLDEEEQRARMVKPDTKRPIYSAACPCCASTLVTLDAALLDPDLPPIGPICWRCSHCGFALMGLAVPVTAPRHPRLMKTTLDVYEATKIGA